MPANWRRERVVRDRRSGTNVERDQPRGSDDAKVLRWAFIMAKLLQKPAKIEILRIAGCDRAHVSFKMNKGEIMEFSNLFEADSQKKPRYCVEAAHEPESEEVTVSWDFHDAAKAQACAEQLEAAGFSCVWLSEWGSWLNTHGNEKKDWFHFWWTKACGFQDTPVKSGRGIRENDGVKGKLRDYLPSPRE